jgi:hypothetical protein
VKRALIVTLSIVAGYLLAAFAGYWAVFALSPNRHDLALEAAMSAVFAFGPVGAAIGAIAGFVIARSRGGT